MWPHKPPPKGFMGSNPICATNTMTQQELYWLAGLLEGEGSFLKGTPSQPNKCTIAIASSDKDVAEKVSKIFTTKPNYLPNAGKNVPHYKDIWLVKLSGGRAIELMKTLKPLMSVRRQEQIDSAIDSYKPSRKSPSNLKKIEITV